MTRNDTYMDCSTDICRNLKSRMKQPSVNVVDDLNEGCCTVVLQVAGDHNVVAFRRDAKSLAELIITRNRFYGKEAEMEYKITGGLFYHTVITSDGWIVGNGGIGTKYNMELMALVSHIFEDGTIDQGSLKKAQSILTNMVVGHFLIKSPDNVVGLVITSKGTTISKLFKMQDGEFVSVPNAPQYYRKGSYEEFNSDPLIASAEIVGTDLWGVNRRGVIFHDVQISADNTKLRIWAAYDDGSLIERKSEGGPDDIRFLKNQLINRMKLPVIPEMIKIGEIRFE